MLISLTLIKMFFQDVFLYARLSNRLLYQPLGKLSQFVMPPLTSHNKLILQVVGGSRLSANPLLR